MSRDVASLIFGADEHSFSGLSLDLFRWQYQQNDIYRAFVDALNIDPGEVDAIERIPFLPISLFKTHSVQSTVFEPAAVFESSGTTGQSTSRHLVKDLSLYRDSFLQGFNRFYGDVRDYCVLGLLPAYLERQGSSLVFMVDELIRRSGHPSSGFYLHDHQALASLLQQLERENQKTLLIGVSFALLDFAEGFPMRLKHTTVMETGGMKGRRRELTRAEMHDLLKQQLGIDRVHAEYGMTELLSQAYSAGEGEFKPVPWMRVLVRNEDDPFDVQTNGRGIANIIDLANQYSCAFIATDDIAQVKADGRFSILGRMDGSDLRGCSLMVAMD